MKTLRLVAYLFTFIILFACDTLTRVSKENLSFLYNTDVNRIKADFVVFHKAADYSTVYFRIRSSDLLYEKANNSKDYEGGVKVSYKLLSDYDAKEVTDSGTVTTTDYTPLIPSQERTKKGREYLIDSINFKTPEAKIYVLGLCITDINKKSVTEELIEVDKTNPFSAQNFLVRTPDNLPAFKNYFASYEKFRISVNNNSIKRLYVKHYSKAFPVALPAFSEHKENTIIIKPDSIFPVEVGRDTMHCVSTSILDFQRTGIYYIQLDTEEKKGLVIFRYYDDFPEITDAVNMMNPLIYITTKNEFDMIYLAKDKKMEIDNFWIDIAGNPDRARELIKKYYTRVKEANLMFTSYMEGWMTDRGMIYIIFGKPNIVYKNTDNETWIYGSTQSSRSIAFNFYRLTNPFTDNDFGLSRSLNYKNSWYIAVEMWRR